MCSSDLTSRPWSAATWADDLDSVVEAGCKFHLKHKEMWEVIRYVESTKLGREGMRLLFDANVQRTIQWTTPYLRSVGLGSAEIRSLCASIVRTARGHHMYWPIEAGSLREIIRGSQEAQRAIVEAYEVAGRIDAEQLREAPHQVLVELVAVVALHHFENAIRRERLLVRALRAHRVVDIGDAAELRADVQEIGRAHV